METMSAAGDPHRTALVILEIATGFKASALKPRPPSPTLLRACRLLDTQTSQAHNTPLSPKGVRKIPLTSVCPMMQN